MLCICRSAIWACSLEKIARYLLLLISYLVWHNQVRFLEDPIMSSCVKPMIQNKENPVVLLHGFDRCSKQASDRICTFSCSSYLWISFHSFSLFSSCLEWRYTYPLLEEAGYETWAFDILGWGFSDLGLLFYFSHVMFIPFIHFNHGVFSFSSYIRQRNFLHVMWCQSVIIFIR